MSPRPQLVIMARVPIAGAVKTRLASDIGAVEAVRFYRVALTRMLRRFARKPRWFTWLAVTPDIGIFHPVLRSTGIGLIPQGGGDLGIRMQRIMDGLPPGPVVIVGTDVPGVRVRHVAEAFRLLGSHDAVLGPAADGGYWLVGLKRRPRVPRAFDLVRWSSSHALEDTLANLVGLRIAFLEQLEDVDTGADYRRWIARNRVS